MKNNKIFKKNFYTILEERKQMKLKQSIDAEKLKQTQDEEENKLIQKHQNELNTLES